MSRVNVLVLAGYGLNCDYETAYAFELAGAKSTRVHINALVDGSVQLDDFQILVFGGGFSWGDDHGAGVVQAVRFKTYLGDTILEFIDKGNLVLGICNGFQTLVNLGLLPGIDQDYKSRTIALTFNDCGNFQDRWVSLKTNTNSPCVFTKGFDQLESSVEFPVRHGEGKFYAEQGVLKRLQNDNQIALQYAMPDGGLAQGQFPYNPNGSMEDIAGICDPTGRVFGLMPHPEAYNHPTNHPDWTRVKEQMKRQEKLLDSGPTAGVRLLKNGVDFVK
ncbi:MAG: phosphoribosylformylglycinamidine synthase I [Deltaproteobacteria bacterium]|nr:phosphoribosylformylglycinamidine synthase I [Deltaproteobacteria bacterium]